MRAGIAYLIGAITVATLTAATPGCVSKPTFHCTSDSMCVSSDGKMGVCDNAGSCNFSLDPGSDAAASGADTSTVADSGPDTSTDADSGPDTSTGADSGADMLTGVDSGLDSSIVADSGSAEASCSSDAAAGCYACTPTTPYQIINACTSSACVPFDDTNRLTNMPESGTLPPLPTDQ